jgi:hypothetical protein
MLAAKLSIATKIISHVFEWPSDAQASRLKRSSAWRSLASSDRTFKSHEAMSTLAGMTSGRRIHKLSKRVTWWPTCESIPEQE